VTPSPYWRAYVDALPEHGTVRVTNGDLRRLVELLDAIGAECDRLKAEVVRHDGLRRAAETDRDRMERQLYRTDT
jgi:alpha-galactosidase